MSFRNLNKLDCINLLNKITNKSLNRFHLLDDQEVSTKNDKVYKGLYVSNEDTYYYWNNKTF